MKGYTERTKDFWVKNGHEKKESFIKAIKHREMLGDKLESPKVKALKKMKK